MKSAFQKALPINIDPLLEVGAVSFSNASLTTLKVSLVHEIQPGIVYSINAENLYDCAGNLIQQEEATAEFGLPEGADSLDVLINEILFNPRPTGVDFVEIVNSSAKFINLRNWSLASLEDGILKNKTVLSVGRLSLETWRYFGRHRKLQYSDGRIFNITGTAFPDK